MKDAELSGRLAAIEVMLFSIAAQLDAKALDADIRGQKELAVDGLLTVSASDTKIEVLKEMLSRYRDAIGLGQ